MIEATPSAVHDTPTIDEYPIGHPAWCNSSMCDAGAPLVADRHHYGAAEAVELYSRDLRQDVDDEDRRVPNILTVELWQGNTAATPTVLLYDQDSDSEVRLSTAEAAGLRDMLTRVLEVAQ